MTERIQTIHCNAEVANECECAVKEIYAQCTQDALKEIMRLLTEGGINGCRSEGERCCLIGTIAKMRGMRFSECVIPLDAKKLGEIEYWFFQICSMPSALQNIENNHFALLAYMWCEQILLLKQPRSENNHGEQTHDIEKAAMILLQKLIVQERCLIPLLPS